MLMNLLPLLSPATSHGLIIVPYIVPQRPVDHRLKITEQGAQSIPAQKSNKSKEIQFSCKKMSQEHFVPLQDGPGCLLPAAGLRAEVPWARSWREACPQLDRAQPRNRLMEWTISKFPIRMQNKDCKKKVCVRQYEYIKFCNFPLLGTEPMPCSHPGWGSNTWSLGQQALQLYL